MTKVVLITINLTLSVCIYVLISWYKQQDITVVQINQNHLQSIRQLAQISKTNIWLNRYIMPNLYSLPKNSDEANLQIISFFDKNYKKYHLKIVKFIIKKQNIKSMMVSYRLGLDNMVLLKSFMHLDFKAGFIKFNSFEFTPKLLIGSMSLIVPTSNEDKNVSK